MCAHQARIISYPKDKAVQNEQVSENNVQADQDFLDTLSGDASFLEKAKNRVNSCLSEIALARTDNNWHRIVDLFYPLEEKEPELVSLNLETPVRAELAFALSQAGSLEQSIHEYEKCVQGQPDNFFFIAGLAFVHYNLVYSAKNRERIITAAQKARHIEEAHKHFVQAQKLRPEGVTNYYRQAMLYKNVQNMDLKAAPLFRKAVENWEAYDESVKEKRHQEFKNYVKSLYNLASCLLKQNRGKEALLCLEKCLDQDGQKDFVKPEHKYFALGKCHLELNEPEEALKDLEYAATFTDPKNGDYIFELWARALLNMGKPVKALQVLQKIPEKFRRQFVRWTEGDCYAAMQDYLKAGDTWRKSLEKDRRSRHKGLIRLARMEFKLSNYSQCLKYADEANTFHISTYGNPDADGLFWSAAACIRLKDKQKAAEALNELKAFKPEYPMLVRLIQIYEQSFG